MSNPLPDLKPGDVVPNGLYFNLDEEIYHADPGALGSTRLKALAVDPYEAQFEYLHGEDKDSDALLFGSALHARMLEGRGKLDEKFCCAFSEDPTDMLVTDTDLKKFLTEHGQTSVSRGIKADRIRRVQQIDKTQKIFDLEKKNWEDANAGKKILKPKIWAQIEVASRWVQRDPLLSAVMEDGTFIDGAPEVSFFYEDNGVRLKVRWDRLLRHAIIDLKSYAPMWKGYIRDMVMKTIDRMRYDLQAASYERGWQVARQTFLDDALTVYGDEPVEGFLEEAFDRDRPKWIWVMIKSKGAPQPLVVDWQATMARATASHQIEDAIVTYRNLVEKFGKDVEWEPENEAFVVDDTDLPSFFGR